MLAVKTLIIFNIIIGFPDSQPAVEDLRYARSVEFKAL
jgi:hypothetical protein